MVIQFMIIRPSRTFIYEFGRDMVEAFSHFSHTGYQVPSQTKPNQTKPCKKKKKTKKRSKTREAFTLRNFLT